MRAEEILKESTLHTLNINEGSPLHEAVIKAMKEYGRECSQASLEKASESAKVEKEYSIKYQDFIPDGIDKESITNPENIILL